MEWEVSAPVLKNKLFWYQLAVVSGSGALFVLLLLLGLNLYERHWEQIPDSLTVGGVLFAGMYISFGLIALAMFFRGSVTRYVLSYSGIYQYTLQRRSKLFQWLGLLGILSGKSAGYTAAGASMLADARSTVYVEWSEVCCTEVSSGSHEIMLRDEWHTKMQVFCPQEKCEKILGIIQSKVKREKDPVAKNTPESMTFLHKILFTLFGVIFGIFLLPSLPVPVVPLFSLIMLLIFLLALWSDGKKGRVAALAVLLLAIGLPAISAVAGGVSYQKDGAAYALVIEVVLYFYFAFVAYLRLRRQ